MPEESKILVFNYTAEEERTLDTLLAHIEAPPAMRIDPARAHLTLREIINGTGEAAESVASDEKVLLFHAIPEKGVRFLIQVFRQSNLPSPIYAVVTEHSITWRFRDLLEHLVEERNRFERRGESAS